MTMTFTANPTHIMPITFQAPVIRHTLTGSVFQARRRSVKVRHKWALKIPHYDSSGLGSFFGFFNIVQQDIPFWFDGAGMGTVVDVLVSETDGSQTEFLLPHDNITEASLVCKVNGVVKADWTLTGSSGALVFATPPAAGTLTASYTCKFLCVFDAGEEGITAERFFHAATTQHFTVDMTIQEIASP